MLSGPADQGTPALEREERKKLALPICLQLRPRRGKRPGPMSPSPSPTVEVLLHDTALLVLNKPVGMVVHRGWATDDVTALDVARRIAGKWVYPVHRLDRATSGALMFALSPEIAAQVGAAFAEERVHKRYLALVRGLSPDALCIDHALAREKGTPKLRAVTHVRRLASHPVVDELTGVSRCYSWVEALPATGRPHQVRRHLKHISHPIIGDVRYGKGDHNRLFRRRYGLTRMVLHASGLSLPHPLDGSQLQITAPTPPDLAQLLALLPLET